MLRMTQLTGFGVGGASAAISFTDSANDTSGLTSYTFTARAIGPAAANRKVVAAVCVSGSAVISGVTIGGVTASSVVSKANASANETVSLWQAAVPTGTTADVVVSCSPASNSCGLGLWAVYGAASAAYHTNTADAHPAVATLNIPAGGVAIGAAEQRSSSAVSFTWTNLGENYDSAIETNDEYQSGASAASPGDQTALSITAASSGAGVRNEIMALASWAPG